MRYVTETGEYVDHLATLSTVYDLTLGWMLRADMVGHADKLGHKLLELDGARSEPRFGVVVCSWCQGVLRLKRGSPGLTHGICGACVEQYRSGR